MANKTVLTDANAIIARHFADDPANAVRAQQCVTEVLAKLGGMPAEEWAAKADEIFNAALNQYWDKDTIEAMRTHLHTRIPPAASEAEPLVRYCPGCGSVGPIEGKYRDCCPDGSGARMVPQALAQKCRDTFTVAVKAIMASAAANDARVVPVAAMRELAAYSEGSKSPKIVRCAREIFAWLNAAPAAQPEKQAAQELSVSLTGAELADALEYVAPDRDADQMEAVAVIRYGDGHSGKGYYCWLADYPDEGAILLGSGFATPPAPSQQAAPAAKPGRPKDHPNDNEQRTDECKAALDALGDDRGQGLDGYWKWGFTSGWNAALKTSPAAESAEPNNHTDDDAVDHFAAAMKEKLAQARAKGRHGWHECPPADLSRMLREHVEKGDPRDVANFCMFLWSLGHPITAATADAHANRPPPPPYHLRPHSSLTDRVASYHGAIAKLPGDSAVPAAQVDERAVAWQACREMVGTEGSSQPSAPASASSLSAADHEGMKVDYSGMLGQAQNALRSRHPGISEMLRQFQGHLEEMGRRWYAGDIAVVDELLQLYCVEEDARATVAAAKPDSAKEAS